MHSQQHAGPILLHLNRGVKYIEGTGGQSLFAEASQNFRGDVVEIGFENGDDIGFPIMATELAEVSPRMARRTLGRVLFSRVPRPKPTRVGAKSRMGPNCSTSSASKAAPVGVINSLAHYTSGVAMDLPRWDSPAHGAGDGKATMSAIDPAGSSTTRSVL